MNTWRFDKEQANITFDLSCSLIEREDDNNQMIDINEM